MHRTPLHDLHVEWGAKMVEFAGWEMPLSYAGLKEEHAQTRESAGLFDVSHMGRVRIKGRHARKLVERLVARRISDAQVGQCRYTFVCNEQGGVKDDVIVMKIDDAEFMIVVNASNREKLLAHFEAVRAAGELKATIKDETFDTAMVAIQGPKVMEHISRVSKEIPTLKRFRFAVKNLLVMKLIVSRTGYTGEDGVEVILPAKAVKMAMKLLVKDAGADESVVKPAGLGARDTLRLEAGMPLYGHELGEEISALACGMPFAMNLDKDEGERGEAFVGMEALKRQRDEGGPRRMLVGMKLDGPRSARQGMVIKADGREVGIVSSGCPSPTLGSCIAMGFVEKDLTGEGTKLSIDAGKAELASEVVPLPFYKKPKA